MPSGRNSVNDYSQRTPFDKMLDDPPKKPAPKKPTKTTGIKPAAAPKKARRTKDDGIDPSNIKESAEKRSQGRKPDENYVMDTPEEAQTKRRRTKEKPGIEPKSTFGNPQTPEELRKASPYKPAINNKDSPVEPKNPNPDSPPEVLTSKKRPHDLMDKDHQDNDSDDLSQYLASSSNSQAQDASESSNLMSASGKLVTQPVEDHNESPPSSPTTSRYSLGESPLRDFNPSELDYDMSEFVGDQSAGHSSSQGQQETDVNIPRSGSQKPPATTSTRSVPAAPLQTTTSVSVELPRTPSDVKLTLAHMTQIKEYMKTPFNTNRTSSSYRPFTIPPNSNTVVHEALLRIAQDECISTHKVDATPSNLDDTPIPGLTLTRAELMVKIQQHTITSTEGVTLPAYMSRTTGILRDPRNAINQAAMVKGYKDLGYAYRPDRGVQMAALIAPHLREHYDDSKPIQEQTALFGTSFGARDYYPLGTLDGNNRQYFCLHGGRDGDEVIPPLPFTDTVMQIILGKVWIVEDKRMSVLTIDEVRHYCMSKNADHGLVGQLSPIAYFELFNRNWKTIKEMLEIFGYYPIGRSFGKTYDLWVQLTARSKSAASKKESAASKKEVFSEEDEASLEAAEAAVNNAKSVFTNLGLTLVPALISHFEAMWRAYMSLGTRSSFLFTTNSKSSSALGKVNWYEECTHPDHVKQRNKLVALLVSVLPVVGQEADFSQTKLTKPTFLRAEYKVKKKVLKKMTDLYQDGFPPSTVDIAEVFEFECLKENVQHLLVAWLDELDLPDCPSKTKIRELMQAGTLNPIALPLADKGSNLRKLQPAMDLIYKFVTQYPTASFNDRFVSTIISAGTAVLHKLKLEPNFADGPTKKGRKRSPQSAHTQDASPEHDLKSNDEAEHKKSHKNLVTASPNENLNAILHPSLLTPKSDARDWIGALTLHCLASSTLTSTPTSTLTSLQEDLAARLAKGSPVSEYIEHLPSGIIDLEAKVDVPAKAVFLNICDGPLRKFDPSGGANHFKYASSMLQQDGFGVFLLPSFGPASYVLTYLINMLVVGGWNEEDEIEIKMHHHITVATHSEGGTEINNPYRKKLWDPEAYYTPRTKVPLIFASQALIPEDGDDYDGVRVVQSQNGRLQSGLELFVLSKPKVALFEPDNEIELSWFKYQDIACPQENEKYCIRGDKKGAGSLWLHPATVLFERILTEIFEQDKPYTVFDLNPQNLDMWTLSRFSSTRTNWVPVHGHEMEFHCHAVDSLLRKIKCGAIPDTVLARGVLKMAAAPAYTSAPVRANPQRSLFRWHQFPRTNQLMFSSVYAILMKAEDNQKILKGWAPYSWSDTARSVLSIYVKEAKSEMDQAIRDINESIKQESREKQVQQADETTSSTVEDNQPDTVTKSDALTKPDQTAKVKAKRVVRLF